MATDVTPSGLRIEVSQILKYGCQVRFKYFGQSYAGAGSSYDDDVSLTQSGSNIWTSGLIFPISMSNRSSSEDAQFLQQGRIRQTDSKLYILGTVPTSGVQVRIGIGSPIVSEYKILEEGITSPKLGNDEVIYKKIYIRRLETGSLAGEV